MNPADLGHARRVPRAQIVARGWSNRCPNCGAHSLFPAHSLRIHEHCPACHFEFDPGGGFWLGPWIINYAVSVLLAVVPLLLLVSAHKLPAIPGTVAAVVLGGFVLPFLLYRQSWSWWLMIYYFLFPGKLPANGGESDEFHEAHV